MNMTPLQLFLAVLAVPMCFAFVCRLDGMNWRNAKAAHIVFHFLGLCYCGSAVFLHPEGSEAVAVALGLAFAGLWLVVSYPTWRDGPPEHVLTRPAPLEVMQGRR